MRPINGNWQGKPGNFDPMHALQPQASDNAWGIPDVLGTTSFAKIDWMMAYDDWRAMRNKGKRPSAQPGAVHFFTDDYRFESCWNNPDKSAAYLAGDDIVLSPDFSLFRDHPPAMWLWNVYRSRWLGAYWQSLGVPVIPTVGWADARSYDFCFLGLPTRSILAVSTIGVFSQGDPTAAELFKAGYREMCERLEPTRVLNYGERFPEELKPLAAVQTFAPFQLQLRTIDAKKAAAALPPAQVAKQPLLKP